MLTKFAKLPETIEGYLRSSIRNSQPIQIKYYPNKNPKGTARSWRTVYALRLRTIGGVQYCLCYYLQGGSVSGKGIGYRLFIVDRIAEARFFNDNVSVDVSVFSNLNYQFKKLYYEENFGFENDKKRAYSFE